MVPAEAATAAAATAAGDVSRDGCANAAVPARGVWLPVRGDGAAAAGTARWRGICECGRCAPERMERGEWSSADAERDVSAREASDAAEGARADAAPVDAPLADVPPVSAVPRGVPAADAPRTDVMVRAAVAPDTGAAVRARPTAPTVVCTVRRAPGAAAVRVAATPVPRGVAAAAAPTTLRGVDAAAGTPLGVDDAAGTPRGVEDAAAAARAAIDAAPRLAPEPRRSVSGVAAAAALRAGSAATTGFLYMLRGQPCFVCMYRWRSSPLSPEQ